MMKLKEIEDAIRALSPEDRIQLAEDLSQIWPEFDGDGRWHQIINDPQPRPALNALLAEAEAEYRLIRKP